jgi:MFS family permease
LLGIIVWSLATAAAFFVVDFWSFLFCRMIVGVGEAAYASIAPALLSDFFPPSERSRMFAIFYLAIP